MGEREPSEIELPVLVVGGGPVGLVQAIGLARYGVRCMVVEAGDGSVTFPTGESLNTRTMEHFRQWGIAHDVRYAGFPTDYKRRVVFVTRVMGYELTRFERTGNDEPLPEEAAVSPESSCWCPKFFLDPVLQRHATSFSEVELRFGWRFEGLAELEDGVEAEIVEVSSGRRQKVRAKYLVGCDGGSSTVRHDLGIKLAGKYAEGRNVGIYFRAPTLLSANPFGSASQYWLVSKDFRGPISAVDGRERWRLSIERTAELRDEQEAAELVRAAVGADLQIEILEVRPWAGHRVVAERYGTSRVFLAGDSAHMMWPRGGFGLNTGIGDAVNLAWKLAATLQGWGGRDLLETYEAERRPIGLRNVNAAGENRAAEMAVPVSEALEEDGEAGERERARVSELIERTRRKEWRSLGIQLGYHYGQSPICVPDHTPAPTDDPSTYEPVARPGSRAPHAWLDDNRSTLDLFGNGFTLLRFGTEGVGTSRLQEVAARRGMPLEVVPVDSVGVEKLYEARLVLIRPDGHVAWRSDTVPSDPEALVDQVCGGGVATGR